MTAGSAGHAVTRITGIVPAKRRSGWVEIRLDGASPILLPDEDAARLALAAGDRIDPDRLERVRDAAARAGAIRRALRYLSTRPRSRREVELRLERIGVDAVVIAAAIERCEALGVLDDREFAAAYVRDRIRLRPCGEARLMADLRVRGVSGADAAAGVRTAFRDEGVREEDLLAREASRQTRRLSRLEPEVARRRLYAALMRRGFPASMVHRWMDGRGAASAE